MAQPLTPKSESIQDLLLQINEGTLVLPEFQRKYEWKMDAVKKLLDSIFHGFPIGSLLFLSYKNQFSIRGFEGNLVEIDEDEVEKAVLDGQQRLTSVYQVIYGCHKSGNFFLKIDSLYKDYRDNNNSIEGLEFDDYITVRVAEGKKAHNRTTITDDLLPFFILKESDKKYFNNQLTAYRDSLVMDDRDKDYIDFVSDELSIIIDPIFTCTVPVLELSNKLSMGAICRIFETLNTSGKSLDSFDICVAKFYKDFKIRQKLDDKLKAVDKNTGQLEYPYLNLFLDQNANRVYILQVIALISECKSHSKNKLPEYLTLENLNDHWSDALDGIEAALKFMNGFGACTDETLALIPYQPAILCMATALARSGYLHGKLDTKLTQQVNPKLMKYFFYTALDLRYGEGAMTKTRDDADSLYRWLKGGDQPEFMKKEVPWYPADFLRLEVDSKGARINMIRCLMNIKTPKDFMMKVDVRMAEKKDLHHIFPFACYKNASKIGYSADSVFNKTYIVKRTNQVIGAKKTTDYSDEIIRDYFDGKEDGFKDVLIAHFIDDEAYECFRNGDYDGFVEARSNAMYKYLKDVVSINVVLVKSQSKEEEAKVVDDLT